METEPSFSSPDVELAYENVFRTPRNHQGAAEPEPPEPDQDELGFSQAEMASALAMSRAETPAHLVLGKTTLERSDPHSAAGPSQPAL